MINELQLGSRVDIFWEHYIDTVNSGLKPNAYKCAITAGYSEDHARNITLQPWFKEKIVSIQRKEIVSVAENILKDTLLLDHQQPDGKIDLGILKLKANIAKTLVSQHYRLEVLDSSRQKKNDKEEAHKQRIEDALKEVFG